ncbi:MAG: YqzL family protein [Clostridiales bacterium]|nr:YqzL family protein [Clostridiales bacterium]
MRKITLIDADYAWKMFSKTGDISYYLLYKRLTEE